MILSRFKTLYNNIVYTIQHIGKMLCMPLIFVSGALFFMIGCTTQKTIYVPVESRVEYRDSLVFISDSIFLTLPIETTTTVIDTLQQSHLFTTIAESDAWVSNGKLHHTLKNKDYIKTKIDTTIQVKYINKFIEKPIPVEVKKEVKHIPTLFWWLLGYAILSLLFIINKLFFTKG